MQPRAVPPNFLVVATYLLLCSKFYSGLSKGGNNSIHGAASASAMMCLKIAVTESNENISPTNNSSKAAECLQGDVKTQLNASNFKRNTDNYSRAEYKNLVIFADVPKQGQQRRANRCTDLATRASEGSVSKIPIDKSSSTPLTGVRYHGVDEGWGWELGAGVSVGFGLGFGT